MEAVCDSVAGEAMTNIDAALDALFAAGVVPANSTDAIRWINVLEQIGRRVDAAKVELLAAIDDDGWHRYDGHRSARVMVEHVGGLSGAESMHRERSRRAIAALPQVRGWPPSWRRPTASGPAATSPPAVVRSTISTNTPGVGERNPETGRRCAAGTTGGSRKGSRSPESPTAPS